MNRQAVCLGDTVIDIARARAEFEKYLDGFDRENDKIRLKIIHTNEVVRCAGEIAKRMNLSREDRELAEVIALLHDIGRFEQVRLFDSFEPATMDHAHFGVQLLFGQGKAAHYQCPSDNTHTGQTNCVRHISTKKQPWIRRFVPSERWDDIIRTAIGCHSDYSLGEIENEQTLLHARLIRDADKLDNCRVKLVDDMQVLLSMDKEEVGKQSITDLVYKTCRNHLSVRSADRITKMDYWVSYIAYFFDINFKETFRIIREQDYVNRIIDRIPYTNPDTREKMEELRCVVNRFVEENM